MKKILWLAVFSFILVVIMGCNLFTSLLSPARKITGTWKSTFPITLYYATDECLNVDTITRVGEQKFNITWIIKQSYNLEPNTVDITVYMEEKQEIGIITEAASSLPVLSGTVKNTIQE